MKRAKPPRATKAELAAIREIERTSAFEKLDRGEAEIVHPRDYPEPMKRFLARERAMLHIRLSARTRRKVEAVSARVGVPPEKLAARWIEERSRREAG
jgi:hypothetical protein